MRKLKHQLLGNLNFIIVILMLHYIFHCLRWWVRYLLVRLVKFCLKVSRHVFVVREPHTQSLDIFWAYAIITKKKCDLISANVLQDKTKKQSNTTSLGVESNAILNKENITWQQTATHQRSGAWKRPRNRYGHYYTAVLKFHIRV